MNGCKLHENSAESALETTPVAFTIWNGLQNDHRRRQLTSLKGSKHFIPEFSLQEIIHFGGELLLKVDCREKNLNSTAEIGEALGTINFPEAALPKIGRTMRKLGWFDFVQKNIFKHIGFTIIFALVIVNIFDIWGQTYNCCRTLKVVSSIEMYRLIGEIFETPLTEDENCFQKYLCLIPKRKHLICQNISNMTHYWIC